MSDNTATQQPKLEDRIREACRVRHYSLATERSYVRWYKQFVRWAGMKHPATLGGDRVEAWLSHLATERDVAASTQRQALAAILFLYRQVLGMTLPWLENVTRAKQPQRLPRGQLGAHKRWVFPAPRWDKKRRPDDKPRLTWEAPTGKASSAAWRKAAEHHACGHEAHHHQRGGQHHDPAQDAKALQPAAQPIGHRGPQAGHHGLSAS